MIGIPVRALAPTAACLLFANLLFVNVASAQTEADRAAARAAFQRGVENFSGERFAPALEAFQEAYRIAPHPSVRVNMANCYEQLDRPVEAIFHFERFLVEAENANPDQVRDVRAALNRLRSQVGEIYLRVAPAGATVTIDDAETRRAPIMDAIRLPAGMHRIHVAADGHRSSSQDVIITGEQRTEVRITLSPGVDTPDPVTDPSGDLNPPDPNAGIGDPDPDQAISEPDPDPDPQPGSGRNIFSTPVIIAGAATIGLAVGAAGAGIAALSANNDFDAAVTRSNDPGRTSRERADAREEGLDAKDKADTRALVADILGFAALAGAAATTFLILFYDDSPDDATATGPRWRAAPVGGPGAAGAVLEGTF